MGMVEEEGEMGPCRLDVSPPRCSEPETEGRGEERMVGAVSTLLAWRPSGGDRASCTQCSCFNLLATQFKVIVQFSVW